MTAVAAGDNGWAMAGVGALYLVIIALYWVPTIVAYARRTRRRAQVLILNLFLGWTVVFWVVALVMAVDRNTDPKHA